MNYDVLIVGGGAAGFFAAINLAQHRPDLKMAILERGATCLEKVRISGGGRCNVAHAEYLPRELSANYPRGERELLGPFHQFMTGDIMAWFEERGVALKVEEDGRIFPVSDSSQTIIDCFLAAAETFSIEIKFRESVQQIAKEGVSWLITTKNTTYSCDKLLIATGSNPKIWQLLEGLGHCIVPAVPSLFTFNCDDPRIADLQGISTEARVQLINAETDEVITNVSAGNVDRGSITGPVLITHWGFSGPAVLRLSALAARELYAVNYRFRLRVNWLIDLTAEDVITHFKELRSLHGKQAVVKSNPFDLPKRLWNNLLIPFALSEKMTWAQMTKEQMQQIATALTKCDFEITGKSTYKNEFVTAGGVDLKEVNFKTFESRLHKNLYFAGEVLNIDAVTGGFNFQNAWTGGFIAAMAMAE